jgi:drug/metabolite transporter (DMT)-like permease
MGTRFQTISRPFSPAPVVAALSMLAMALCYAVTANLARIMGNELDALMITFMRNGFGLLLLAPLLLRSDAGALRTGRPGLHLLRSASNLLSMLAWFWALPHIVLADGVALMFTGPLFASLGAVLLLGERLGRRRAVALAAGFSGMLIIIRPDVSARFRSRPASALPSTSRRVPGRRRWSPSGHRSDGAKGRI